MAFCSALPRMLQVLTTMRSASSGAAVVRYPSAAMSWAMISESRSFIWQPKVSIWSSRLLLRGARIAHLRGAAGPVHRGTGDVVIVHRVPVVGLGLDQQGLGIQQIGGRGHLGLIAGFIDAIIFVGLGNGLFGDADVLPGLFQVEVRLAQLEDH